MDGGGATKDGADGRDAGADAAPVAVARYALARPSVGQVSMCSNGDGGSAVSCALLVVETKAPLLECSLYAAVASACVVRCCKHASLHFRDRVAGSRPVAGLGMVLPYKLRGVAGRTATWRPKTKAATMTTMMMSPCGIGTARTFPIGGVARPVPFFFGVCPCSYCMAITCVYA